ncbi:monovalent cation/H+ antiporter subunit D family protein [archaeon SCG-AAA382B04]|nr:monovalent cation/H+ antiporter subunit D family protein [archaeon SCG-AAA382B04]
MVTHSLLPTIAVVLPIAISPFIFLIGRRSAYLRDGLAVGSLTISFVAILLMAPEVLSGKILESIVVSEQAAPLPISFKVSYFGEIVAIISSFVWVLATIYSIEYMSDEHSKERYYSFLVLTGGSMYGIVLAKNLFALYIFFELMSVVSYVLVIHEETEEALVAGKKYLFMCIGFGLLLFLSIILTYIGTGRLDFSSVPIFTEFYKKFMIVSPKTSLTILFFTYIFGFGTKAGLVPVHIWLPDAHPIAPSPASALLSGVMIKAGAYGIIRTIYNVFGPQLVQELGVNIVLSCIGVLTIFLGAAVAISQTEIKRRLAYSSINQIGYVVLGAAFLTKDGLTGAILHIFNHGLMKGVLFLCAGAIIYKTGLREIEDLKGIGKKMPITMICFTIGALSMMGIPPLCGFISKWILVLGALEAGVTILVGFAGIFLLSAIMDAVYYFPIIRSAFFEEPIDGDTTNQDPSIIMLAPLILLASGIIIFGIFPQIPLSFAEPAAEVLLGGF